MNFKERLRQALKYSNGGYIKNAGGGDQVVYGARHSQGGVMRDENTELEGGGFDENGNPKQGEVITTVFDDGGNPQEFYMSHKNGVAQKYLKAKANNGGSLSQVQKQEFAKLNESMNPDGSPTEIASLGGFGNTEDRVFDISRRKKSGYQLEDGGTHKYFMGGIPQAQDIALDQSRSKKSGYTLPMEDGGTRKYFMGGIPLAQNAALDQSMAKKSGYNLEDGGYKTHANGGIEKYFMGGIPQGQDMALNQSMRKKSGYTLEDGGIAKYPHGGPHAPVQGTDQNQSVISQGKPEQSFGSKAWEIATNPVQAFAWTATHDNTPIPDNFSTRDNSDQNQQFQGEGLDLVTSFVNPAAVADMVVEYGASVKDEGMTPTNMAQGAFMLAFRKKFPKLKGEKLQEKANQVWSKVKNNEAWINPFKGWNAGATKKVKDIVTKVKGKPGNYTTKSQTPMINYVDRTKIERGKNILKKGAKLTTGLGVPYGVYNYATSDGSSDAQTQKEFKFSPDDESIRILTGTSNPSSNAAPINVNTNEGSTDNTQLEELSSTDSIPFTSIGSTIDIDGVSWRRLSEANDSTGWERVE